MADIDPVLVQDIVTINEAADETPILSTHKILVEKADGSPAWIKPTTEKEEVGLGKVANKTEAEMVADGAIKDALALRETVANVNVLKGTGWAGETVRGNADAIASFVGVISYFAMSTAPTGWLKCNGATVSRVTYANLFSKIGTTFGAGDGSTTFHLPDLRGEFLRGWDDSRGVDSGRSFGSAQSDAFKSHKHTFYVDNSNIDKVPLNTRNGSINAYSSIYSEDSMHIPYPTNGNHIGSTGATETRPRNIALLACIKY